MSDWANPFTIGVGGSRDTVLSRFKGHLYDSPALLARLKELGGCTLLCHCGARDACHADVLIKAYVDEFEPEGLSDGPTSCEDELGGLKPLLGSGWVGTGPALSVGRGARRRDMQDGGGLCSPGLWPPDKRRLPPLGRQYLKAVEDVMDKVELQRGHGFWNRLVCSLACSRIVDDPFGGADLRVKEAFVTILREAKGFERDGKKGHMAATIDFELIGAIAEHLGDPDAAVLELYRSGVPLGWRQRLPRTPAVFARKLRWAPHVGHELGSVEWAGNYRSASERPDFIRDNFASQVENKMMVKTTYRAAKSEYGERLRVASLGALEQHKGDFRVIHDGTHGVRVNPAIRVRDKEACPMAHDLVAALDYEICSGTNGLFVLALDVSKAHRRVPVAAADWGLQACSDLPFGQQPGPEETVWLNTVCTYGIGSSSYWWGRLGALIVRLLHYVAGPAGLRWGLRFADDFILVSGGLTIWRPLAVAVLFLCSLGIPLKWTKFRGGLKTEWIGYYFDLENREAGISDARSRWASAWCRRVAEERTVLADDFREGLGRLAFAAALLVFTKPFLGPLYAWASAIPAGARAEVPPLVKWVLTWVAEKFEERVRIKFGTKARHLGERYRADAKAEGENIVIGGWEVVGGEGTSQSRWFSMRFTRAEIPWAYIRGDPFRSIAALELLATLVCVMALSPQEPSLTGALIALTASGDNQSNGFTLDKLCSTKFPLYLVLMELSEQLRSRQLVLSVAWRPRDENEEADALTNERFGAFSLDRRVHVKWSDLRFSVLPRLTDQAVRHFEELQKLKAAARRRPHSAQATRAKRGRLMETDPW